VAGQVLIWIVVIMGLVWIVNSSANALGCERFFHGGTTYPVPTIR
jgi:hypothetical protein